VMLGRSRLGRGSAAIPFALVTAAVCLAACTMVVSDQRVPARLPTVAPRTETPLVMVLVVTSAPSATAAPAATARATVTAASAQVPPTLALTVQAAATFTAAPMPSATPAPSNTPAPPTETPLPTATFAPTDTPGPTDTPAPPTDTPVPTDTPLPTETPTPVPTPTPAVTWRVASWRQLTACENRGGHTLFINVTDAAGNGVAGVPLLVLWDGGSQVFTTGEKMDKGPGWVEVPLYGAYTAQVYDGNTSEVTPWLDSHLRADERCAEINDDVANSFGHYSYEVIFQRAY
jgi:hypothetical protein